jgi:hypothetical protein
MRFVTVLRAKGAIVLTPNLYVTDWQYHSHDQCQKEAWKNEEHPHKVLCPLIRSFREQLGPELWATLWRPGFDLSTFVLPPQAKESADPKLAEEIGNRLALLLAAKANHSKN